MTFKYIYILTANVGLFNSSVRLSQQATNYKTITEWTFFSINIHKQHFRLVEYGLQHALSSPSVARYASGCIASSVAAIAREQKR